MLVGQTNVFGALTLTGSSSAGRNFTTDTSGDTVLGSVSATTLLDAESTGGKVDFATLTGAGSKLLNAGTSITGTSIGGSGSVTLRAVGAIAPGSIGASGAPVAFLDVKGGSLTLGTTFVLGVTQTGVGAGLGFGGRQWRDHDGHDGRQHDGRADL